MTQVKLGDKNIPFIYQGNELLYPNPIKDGLVLWYDFKGMKNSDVGKDVAKDLSGNGNDGMLQNFAYNSESGYNEGLKFDGIDDYIEIPDLYLENNEMTVGVNSEFFIYQENSVNYIKDTLKTSSINLLLNSKKRNAINGSSNSKRVIYKLSKKIEEGKEYTLTFNLELTRGENFKETSLLFSGDLSKRIRVPLNNESNNQYTFIATEDTSEISIFIGVAYTNDNLNAEGFVTNAKLVENVSTRDWVPNQKDFLNNISLSEICNLLIYNKALTDQEIQHNYKLEKERWGL